MSLTNWNSLLPHKSETVKHWMLLLHQYTIERKAKNYTQLIGDDYQPSFSIDEDYFHQAVKQHQQDKEDYYRIGDAKRDDSIYQTFHKIELSKTGPPTPPRRPLIKPALPPKTIAEATQCEVTDAGRDGIIYQADPAAELIYNYGPALESDTLHCHIRGGSVDGLIAEATVYRDVEFVETVIFTHTTFITTEELLEKLTIRFEHFRESNPVICENCVKLFIGVLGNVWTGLTKPMINITNQFTEMLFKHKMLRDAQNLEHTLAEQYSYCQAPAPTLPSVLDQPWATFLKLKPQQVALQMTQIDMEKFQQIKMCEILKYVKVPSEATSPNVCSFVHHFNSVSSWACTLILRRDTKENRLRVYRRLLSVMEHLIKLKNFSSSLALLAALSKTAVKRVVHLSNKQEKILASSLELMDNSESFKKLRTVLRQSKPPSIPYLGLCIADLTFLLLGNPDLLQDGNTNFTKRYGAYTFMNNIRRHQEVSYNIPAKPEIITFFNNFSDYMDDESLWSRSEEIKPRVKRKQK